MERVSAWVIVCGTGALYPIGSGGGKAAYIHKEVAEDVMMAIADHDKAYVKGRGGLHLEEITAEAGLFKQLGLNLVTQEKE